MATFLNRKQIVSELSVLLNSSVKEVVMVVPYINISDPVYENLKDCAERGIEIILLYREDKMNESEKEKLISLGNITLFSHPNVHSKCYLNETAMIIGSMNLYEYSEKNNREMGVLLQRNGGDEECYYDAIKEVQSIISSCKSIEFKSNNVAENGFNFQILKSWEETLGERLIQINKIFEHKNFVSKDVDDRYTFYCNDYLDDVNVRIDLDDDDNDYALKDIKIHRIEIDLGFPIHMKVPIYKIFKEADNEHLITDFRMFWNNPNGAITLYRSKNPKWKVFGFEEDAEYFRKGINDTTEYIARVIKDNGFKK